MNQHEHTIGKTQKIDVAKCTECGKPSIVITLEQIEKERDTLKAALEKIARYSQIDFEVDVYYFKKIARDAIDEWEAERMNQAVKLIAQRARKPNEGV